MSVIHVWTVWLGLKLYSIFGLANCLQVVRVGAQCVCSCNFFKRQNRIIYSGQVCNYVLFCRVVLNRRAIHTGCFTKNDKKVFAY